MYISDTPCHMQAYYFVSLQCGIFKSGGGGIPTQDLSFGYHVGWSPYLKAQVVSEVYQLIFITPAKSSHKLNATKLKVLGRS